MTTDQQAVYNLERPHPALWRYYILASLMTGPGVILTLPYLFFRYQTLRYRFDEEGIHMKVGIFFRKEVNLTYARIQDIHLRSGLVQRWLGLADIDVQTASGSAGAELKIEGFKEFEMIRDFLYTKMRGYQDPAAKSSVPTNSLGQTELVQVLQGIRDELRATREILEQQKTAK